MQVLFMAWRWWADSCRRPRLAQRLYLLLATGFAGLAVAGGLLGDAAVAAVAGVFAALTVGLAFVMPRFLRSAGRSIE